jgi:hypothetical protein
LKELINNKTLIRNFIISILFGIVVPYLIEYFFLSKIDFFSFNFSLIIANGIILTIAYSTYGIFKKHTFIRLILGLIFIIVQIYLFSVGSNPYTLYLPQDSFAQLSLSFPFEEFSIQIGIFYGWILIPYFILKGVNLIRHYIKKETEEWKLKTFSSDSRIQTDPKEKSKRKSKETEIVF